MRGSHARVDQAPWILAWWLPAFAGITDACHGNDAGEDTSGRENRRKGIDRWRRSPPAYADSICSKCSMVEPTLM